MYVNIRKQIITQKIVACWLVVPTPHEYGADGRIHYANCGPRAAPVARVCEMMNGLTGPVGKIIGYWINIFKCMSLIMNCKYSVYSIGCYATSCHCYRIRIGIINGKFALSHHTSAT